MDDDTNKPLGLWKDSDGRRLPKYLVVRRDGSVPAWNWFVLGAARSAAPAALRAYAESAENNGFDAEYVHDVRFLAEEFEEHQRDFGHGDPDARKHRWDDPVITSLLQKRRVTCVPDVDVSAQTLAELEHWSTRCLNAAAIHWESLKEHLYFRQLLAEVKRILQCRVAGEKEND